MANESDKFLQTEESAEKLLETLQELYDEVESYSTSKEALDQVREQLVDFIESSRETVKDTHEIIKILKSIGGPEILRVLSQVLDAVNNESSKNIKALDQLKSEISQEMDSGLQKTAKALKQLKIFLIANLVVLISGFAVVAILLRK